MSKFTFLNHASYVIETDKSILLVDPWVEGYAFNKGWALLDKSTSNEKLYSYLSTSNKKIFIWFSHEHSDHFSVPFLLGLKKLKINVKFIYQKTLDGRVANFIKKNGFKVIETRNKKEIIDSELSIVTFPYRLGDSYCLTLWKNYSILNINDCVIDNDLLASTVKNSIKKYTNKVDLLITQYGYANWGGNYNDKKYRAESAQEKLRWIKIQLEHFKPKYTIPFASMFYYCQEENFYLNDSQNTAEDVENFFNEEGFINQLIVLKPMDSLDLSEDLLSQNREIKNTNILYWKNLFNKIRPDKLIETIYQKDEIAEEYKIYRKKIYNSFLFFPALLEKYKKIFPIIFYVKDINTNFTLSYMREIKIESGNKLCADISISSATLMFVLKNEYGWDTTEVNGKFSRLSTNGNIKATKHFIPQVYMKMGYGLKHPFISFLFVVSIISHKLSSIFKSK